jgi:transcriptional regulator with XRE-family HTH domain
MLHEKIPQNIRKFRELKQITREEIASQLNLTLNGYAKIEQGKVEITIKRLKQVAKILQVEVREILEFEVKNIFNIKNNTLHESQMISNRDSILTKNNSTEYLEKLIESLERENQLLRELHEKSKKS